VLFFGHGKSCKLHKTRPGSFFAQLKPLHKNKLQEFKSIQLIRHKQISHSAQTFTRSLKFKLQTHSGAELMQSIFSCHIAGHIS
jgi:tRNA(Leu) C34 or U34 (ribose-2'-O)-methylase TrmL